ncbi:MAG: hypothetical protein KIH02_11315 [Parabacteroides sp.]|nr:hypothetical protein [Parabacteroides sp.]
MFLLSFGLAGMNMVDLMTCTDYVDGWINYQRTKTQAHKRGGSFISVPVMPEVRPLLFACIPPLLIFKKLYICKSDVY